ncbi:MAG: hypothetical protein L0J59_10890 [Lactococcus lactis]|nr:hypothetical protein [Lactococcus lactis]
MKNIITIIVIVIFSSNCIAQSPVISVKKWYKEQAGTYYKDLNNEMDAFVGTWLYTEGNTSLKIKLKKETMHYNGKYYVDLMVGEYQYIKNGVELINTLNNFDLMNGYEHRVYGKSLYQSCIPYPASDCVEGETRLSLSFFDTLKDFSYTFIFHKREVNGQPALRAFNVCRYYNDVPLGTTPPEPTMPCQNEILLLKVE